MNPVTPPIKPKDKGDAVANLHEALLFLLNKPDVFSFPPRVLHVLKEKIQREVSEKVFGEITKGTVLQFQKDHGLVNGTGEVDQPTSDALNSLLNSLGAFNEQPPQAKYEVKGRIKASSGHPFKNGIVIIEHVDESNSVGLGTTKTSENGTYSIIYSPPPGGRPVRLRVTAVGPGSQTLGASPVIPNAGPLDEVDLVLRAEEQPWLVKIFLRDPDGKPVVGVKVQIFDRDPRAAQRVGEVVFRRTVNEGTIIKNSWERDGTRSGWEESEMAQVNLRAI